MIGLPVGTARENICVYAGSIVVDLSSMLLTLFCQVVVYELCFLVH